MTLEPSSEIPTFDPNASQEPWDPEEIKAETYRQQMGERGGPENAPSDGVDVGKMTRKPYKKKGGRSQSFESDRVDLTHEELLAQSNPLSPEAEAARQGIARLLETRMIVSTLDELRAKLGREPTSGEHLAAVTAKREIRQRGRSNPRVG